MDSAQVGPVLGPPGGPQAAAGSAGTAHGPTGSVSEPWPDGELSDPVEPCLAEELSGLADEPCPAGEAPDATGAPSECRAREVLQRVGDKWSVQVIDLLGQDTKRFSELHRSIDGITARMLTVTLRGLERDGIVTRTVHAVIPPRVDYALTPMGRTLLDTIGQLITWADNHLSEIEAARAAYDAKRPR